MITVQDQIEADIDAWVTTQVDASPELSLAQLSVLWTILDDSVKAPE